MSTSQASNLSPQSTPGRSITLRVNGESRSVECHDRQLLVEVVRDQLALKGTHVGCMNGDCGACTLELDGQIVKSCLMLAASADGGEVNTVESLGSPDELAPVPLGWVPVLREVS